MCKSLDNNLEFPTISIIIPAYNEERYIASAIECFLKNKYSNIEVIVVDDGSKDKTAEIASNFPVKLIKIEHSGPAKAKNIGIKEAKGELVVFHDANDIILDENFLTKIAETYLLSGKKVDLILIPMKTLPRKSGFLNKAMFIRDYLAYKPKFENGVPIVTLLRTVFKSDYLKLYAKFNEDLGAMEDRFFLTKTEPQKVISKYTSIQAIGGAMDSLREMTSRWMWYGKSLIPIWKYCKREFLLRTSYAIYWPALFLIQLLFLINLININMLLIFYMPAIIWFLQRWVKSYACTRTIKFSLFLPILDILLGFCYFIGLSKALILLLIKKYTPAK